MGSSILLKYHTIYVAWNAFLRLMEINYPQCFSCPICRDTPDTVIIDGVTLGTVKELPPESLPTDNTISQYVPISRRVWVSNPRVRKLLQNYVKDGLSPQEFNLLYANLEPKSFQTYVANSYSSSTPEGNVNYRPNNPNIKSILKYFSSTDPLVGIFQFSILNKEELLLLMDLANGHSGNTELVEIIYAKMVNLQTLFRSYELEVLPLNHLRLHPIVSALLMSFIEHTEYLYTQKSRNRRRCEIQDCYHEYFPGLEQYR